MKKRIFALLLTGILGLSSLLTGCNVKTDEFDKTKEITVISREASSGTRSAFDELMKIVRKDGENKKDALYAEAILVNSTDEVASKVEVDPYAIGYTSIGSVNDKVKAIAVDGVVPTIENVNNGTYRIARPFLLATKEGTSPAALDFIQFLTSKQGQELVAEKGYIQLDENAPEYTASGVTGKITLSGSTSVEKVMEKAKETYCAQNAGVEIEIIYSGSGAGIKDVTEGKVDIGMSSRELSTEETDQLTATNFALDGIAVIVNSKNSVSALSSSQITSIFTGETRTWEEK